MQVSSATFAEIGRSWSSREAVHHFHEIVGRQVSIAVCGDLDAGPASDVDAEEQLLADVLESVGYDVGKLSLNVRAEQVLADRAKAVVIAIGIEPSNWPHYPLGNGGVEVRFQFSREEDQVNAKLALA